MFAFIICSVVALILIGIGVYSLVAKKPVSFYSGIEAPKVTDTKKYNRAVAVLWFVYGILLELFATPFLFMKNNLVVIFITLGGTIAVSIALPIIYSLVIVKKYEEK